jgi:hypothetical protein
MNLQEIVERMEKGLMPPEEVAEARNYCAALVYRYNSQYGQAEAQRATWVVSHQGGYNSLSAAERAWEATEDGQTQIALKYKIRGIDVINDALATNWFLHNREARNQM